MNDERKSSRKLLLGNSRVRFDGGVGEYSEEEEVEKQGKNKLKY